MLAWLEAHEKKDRFLRRTGCSPCTEELLPERCVKQLHWRLCLITLTLRTLIGIDSVMSEQVEQMLCVCVWGRKRARVRVCVFHLTTLLSLCLHDWQLAPVELRAMGFYPIYTRTNAFMHTHTHTHTHAHTRTHSNNETLGDKADIYFLIIL